MNTNNTLLVHAGICIVALAATGVGCNLLNLPVSATEGIVSLVGVILLATGMMTVASSASNKAMAQTIADAAQQAIADLEAKHAKNATGIAVHTAQIEALKAPVVTLSVPSPQVGPLGNVSAPQPITVSTPEVVVNPPPPQV